MTEFVWSAVFGEFEYCIALTASELKALRSS